MKRYSIKAASRLTGITPDTLRAWERRYAAVVPLREPQGRRYYTPDDLTRLQLLKRGTELGHPIRNLAGLQNGALKELVDTAGPDEQPLADPLDGVNDRLFEAVRRHDLSAFERLLSWTAAALPPRSFVHDIVQPLLVEIGQRWSEGRLSIGQEHAMSASLRNVLGGLIRSCPQPTHGPALLFATPAGERHEFGILLPHLLAACQGVRCLYLGVDLPPWEIVKVAQQTETRVIAMSLTFTERPDDVAHQLTEMQRLLDGSVELWVGGHAAQLVLARSNGLVCTPFQDLPEFEQRLELFRSI